MSRFWGGVLVMAVAMGCTPPRQRGCYEGCLAGTVCDEPTQYCVVGSADADAGRPDAGIADAGSEAGVDAGLSCASSGCPAWSECLDQLCVDRYAGITVTAPLRTGGSFDVSATLQLRAGATPNPPATLQLSAQLGAQPTTQVTLVPDGGAWIGSVPAMLDGVWGSTVTWPGAQLSGTAVTTVDLTAPRFEVTIVAAPTRRVQDGGVNERDPADPPGVTAWRRDETGGVTVRSLDSDLLPATVQIRVGDLLLPYDAGCITTGCAFAVDYSRPTFKAWRGTLPVVVTATDDLGNTGPFDGGGVRLTRLQWRRSEPTIAGNQFVGFVALDPDGTIWFTRGTKPDGELVVLQPNGDLALTRLVVNTPVTAPMRGKMDGGVATFGARNFDPALRQVDLASPYVEVTSSRAGAGALGPVLMAAEGPFAEVASWAQGGRLLSLPTTWPENTAASGFQPTARGRKITTVTDTGDISSYTHAFSGLFVQSPGQVLSAAAPTMAWEQADGSLIGVTGTSTTRRFWTLTLPGVTEYPPDAGEGPNLPFAFRQGEAWYTTLHALCRGVPGATPTCLTLPGNGGFGYGAVLTAGQKVIVVASRTGTDSRLVQVDGTTMTIEWEAALTDPGVPLQLQHVRCLRGTLGVGVGVNLQGDLVSAVIDQPGIDATADWAQFSHDPQNTFNFSTPLSPYSCP